MNQHFFKHIDVGQQIFAGTGNTREEAEVNADHAVYLPPNPLVWTWVYLAAIRNMWEIAAYISRRFGLEWVKDGIDPLEYAKKVIRLGGNFTPYTPRYRFKFKGMPFWRTSLIWTLHVSRPGITNITIDCQLFLNGSIRVKLCMYGYVCPFLVMSVKCRSEQWVFVFEKIGLWVSSQELNETLFRVMSALSSNYNISNPGALLHCRQLLLASQVSDDTFRRLRAQSPYTHPIEREKNEDGAPQVYGEDLSLEEIRRAMARIDNRETKT